MDYPLGSSKDCHHNCYHDAALRGVRTSDEIQGAINEVKPASVDDITPGNALNGISLVLVSNPTAIKLKVR
ncbi:hypothetical protein ABEB36_005751 [Hypothenemus hampei]|uniref:Uncharacterized protein n=1 Tax=Hypothenemus hampei TaxID=57062 RepID=A0ABD1F2E2_HYPHA